MPRAIQKRRVLLVAAGLLTILIALCLHAQDKSGFPYGYDAVKAAPKSHKVIFENEFVRVLEVTYRRLVPPNRCTTIVGLVSF
ncbi:MAG TPA: hypothetical protein VE545_01515 [Candidatus Dormibacteraeota bacterium]|nr:hypothetical protein [Candidatus Dormibacteraeota bacterium]